MHTAVDCSDYQNVKEDLVSYDKDSKNRQVKRIVNQYYTDPQTGEKIYINNGIISPFKFPYQEYACGDWDMDDENLQATRRTQIRAFDNVANKYVDITSCDYSTDEGKTGRIVQPYIKLPSTKEGKDNKDDMNGTYTFELKEAKYHSGDGSVHQSCKHACIGHKNEYAGYTAYYLDPSKTTQWQTTYKTTRTGITTGYQRPKQDWEKEPSIFYKSIEKVDIDRTTVVLQNDLNLDADYMKFYEVNENYYKDESIKTTPEFTSFITKYYKKGAGFCQAYQLIGGDVGYTKHYNGAYVTNLDIKCTSYSDYILPTN